MSPQAKRGLRFVCPRRSEHTPHPDGYIAHAEWAERMLKTHVQVQCPGCDLWAIWIPRNLDEGGPSGAIIDRDNA